jgi:hypothetical protein
VAVYVDSVFAAAGGLFSVADSVYLKQETNNDVYRYASLLPEFDVSGIALLDIGKLWMHEAKLSATSANWFVAGDTMAIPLSTGVPGIDTVYLAVVDNASASSIESMTISNTAYTTTKTTHTMELKIFVQIPNPVPVGPTHIPLVLKTESLSRITWMSPALGAIVKETRDGRVIAINQQGYNFSLPVPGYYSEMKAVLATGN